MKVSITKCKVHGEVRYRVRWRPPGGKRQSHYHPSFKEADHERKSLERQHKVAGDAWMAMKAQDRMELMQLWSDAREGGYTLKQARDYYLEHIGQENVGAKPMTLKVALETLVKEMKTARRSDRTVKAIRSNVGRFIKGRDMTLVSAVTRDMVSQWMDQFKNLEPTSWNSYRLSMVTFFNWCMKQGYTKLNPAEPVPIIDLTNVHRDKVPTVFTVDQAERLLCATLLHDPGLIRYVSVCLFGGLRPDREGAELLKGDFELEPGHIFVRGFSAKTGQQRFVEIHPTLAAWLKLGGDYGREVKGGVKRIVNIRRRFEEVRVRAGLITRQAIPKDEAAALEVSYDRKRLKLDGWEQDVMRHTFASHYLPLFGAEKTVDQLGHGKDYTMLFRHYRRLVPKSQAERFWALTPEVVVRRALLRVVAGGGSRNHRIVSL